MMPRPAGGGRISIIAAACDTSGTPSVCTVALLQATPTGDICESRMRKSALIAASALLAAACGAGHSASTRTSIALAGSHVLKGCYSLPFSGGEANLLPVNYYNIKATPSTICFRTLGAGSKCSPAPGSAQSYGNPIVDTDEPRSGGYTVVYYYPNEHRWFLAPGCPSS
jgi:hypothetical protein